MRVRLPVLQRRLLPSLRRTPPGHDPLLRPRTLSHVILSRPSSSRAFVVRHQNPSDNVNGPCICWPIHLPFLLKIHDCEPPVASLNCIRTCKKNKNGAFKFYSAKVERDEVKEKRAKNEGR